MNEFEQLYKRKQVLDENIAKNALFKLSVKEWIFLCDEIALPEIWKSDVRKVEIIMCEFTRVMFCLNHKLLSWRYHGQHQYL